MRLRKKIPKLLVAVMVALGAYATVSSSSAQTNPPPAISGMAGLPTIQQEELTLDAAKAGIDSFLALREKYGDDELPDLNPSAGIGAAQAFQQYAGIQNMIASYGFEDIDQWYRVITSLFLAHTFQAEGKLKEYEQSLQQMEQANLPAETRNQMIVMMNAMKPSDNNLAIAATLNEDSEYGPKLKKMQD